MRMLRRGKIPIYEPGLEELVRATSPRGASCSRPSCPRRCAAAQVIFIAVGTPQGEDGSADLRHVLDGGARRGAAP